MSLPDKLNIFKKYKEKLNHKFSTINNEIIQLSHENIELRLKLKKLSGEKINVVFVCHRPAVWGSLKTVYEAMKADSSFDVKIVTCPNKKQLPKIGLCHEIFESEGAEEFWKGDDVIQGYNYETGEWLDLRKLKPDYVFFQRSYNIELSLLYKSWEVTKFAKICYVEYGYNTNKKLALECIPADFMKDVSLFFLQNNTENEWYNEYFNEMNNSFTKRYITGFPRFDSLEKYKNSESDNWKKPHADRFRVIWTPRWATEEHNCHFFDYKEKLINYCKQNENSIDFILRPHPQMFTNFKTTKEMTQDEIKAFKQIFENSKNLFLDETKDYLNTFYSSDCLIADYTSLIPEYFLTGKPIIYCYNEKALYNIEGEIFKGLYLVHNWDELVSTLELLRKGEDSLKAKREEITKNHFNISAEGAGFKIKEIIKEDFLNA